MFAMCHSPIDGRLLDHSAEGWLCSPEGKPIVAMCKTHAQQCIDEYREKLGEQWAFKRD